MKEIGARRLDAGRVKALMATLGRHVTLDRVEVKLLSGGQGLEYPADEVDQAIDDYDVKNLTVWGRRNDLTVRVDLPPSFLSGAAFRFQGPRDAVPAVDTAVREQIENWSRTLHWLGHRWPGYLIILVAFNAMGPLASAGHTTLGILLRGLAVVGYLFLLFGNDTQLPYIWFERPHGLVARRRRMVGAVGSLVLAPMPVT